MARAVVEADAVLGDVEIVADPEDAHGVVDRRPPDSLLMLANFKRS